jgi:predicted phosphodiesterase
MKVAVLSDVHANLAAFKAVLLHIDSVMPDVVLVGGDIINRGPQPRECLEIVLDRIKHHGWKVIRGNHEDYVLRTSRGVNTLKEWEQKVMSHTCWTEKRVADYLPAVAAWPDETGITAPDGSQLICTHASRKGNRVGLYTAMNDEELIDHAHPDAKALCVGHTHIPFVRKIHDRLIVNAGAVGMPFDGDHRAAYALVTWSAEGWEAEVVRVPYDRQVTENAYHETGYLTGGGPMVPLIHWELRHARARLGYWHRCYESAVAAGKIGLEESVQIILNEPVQETTSFIASHK